jgi:hypothetical protein
MSEDPIQPTDAPDLTRLSSEQLCRRYRERNDLAQQLYVRWMMAADHGRAAERLLATSRPVRNEVARCEAEMTSRGLRID